MKTKLVFGFDRLRDDELATRVVTILEKMAGNANVPNPVPALADVIAASDAYRQALALSKEGGKEERGIKNTRRSELEALLYDLAMHVEITCKSDRDKLLSTGFLIRKEPAPVGVLESPANFTLENGYGPGSIRLSVGRLPGAGSYLFEYTTVPVTEASQWTVHVAKGRTHIFEGLARGQEYAFRVAGVGAHTARVYSDVISRFVQ